MGMVGDGHGESREHGRQEDEQEREEGCQQSQDGKGVGGMGTYQLAMNAFA